MSLSSIPSRVTNTLSRVKPRAARRYFLFPFSACLHDYSPIPPPTPFLAAHREHPARPIITPRGQEPDEQAGNQALQDGAARDLRKGRPLDELVEAVKSLAP